MTLYKAKMHQIPSVKGTKKTPFIQGSLIHKKSSNENNHDVYYIVPERFMVLDGKIDQFYLVKPHTICQHVKDDLWENDILRSEYNIYYRIAWDNKKYQWRLLTGNSIDDEFNKIIKSYAKDEYHEFNPNDLPFWFIDHLYLEKYGNICDDE